MRRHTAWIRRVTLSNIMRFSVYDGVFSPAACTLLHAFSSWDHSSIVARNTLLEGAPHAMVAQDALTVAILPPAGVCREFSKHSRQ